MKSRPQSYWLSRRFQITLRTAFACLTIACVVFAWIAYEYARSRRELLAARRLADFGVEVGFDRSVAPPPTLIDNGNSSPDQAYYFEKLLPAARWAGLRNNPRVNDSVALQLRSFSRLQSLQIEWVNVTDSGIAVVAELPQLAVLVIDEVDVTDEGLFRICSGTQLRFLFIGRCQITNQGLSNLELLDQSLRELAVHGSWLSDDGATEIARCRALRALSLTHTSISDAGVHAICEIPTLEHLYLSDTQVTDNGVKELLVLEQLKTLHLEKTKVTDSCLESIAKLPKLRWLRIYDCAISPEAVASFKALRPSVEVDY